MGQITDTLFNSPLEIGLRLLFLFNATSKAFDLQRLIYYNYLLVHSSDISSAPGSLHPDLPNRSCEIFVNRHIVQSGLKLLLTKKLIDVKYVKSGIAYKSNKLTSAFIEHFACEYSSLLKDRASWVTTNFDSMSDKKLVGFFNENIGKWGSEFSREYINIDAK